MVVTKDTYEILLYFKSVNTWKLYWLQISKTKELNVETQQSGCSADLSPTRWTRTTVLSSDVERDIQITGPRSTGGFSCSHCKTISSCRTGGCGFGEKHEPHSSGIRKGAVFSTEERVPASVGNRRWTRADQTPGEEHLGYHLHSPENPSPNKKKIGKMLFCFQYEKETTTTSNHRL